MPKLLRIAAFAAAIYLLLLLIERFVLLELFIRRTGWALLLAAAVALAMVGIGWVARCGGGASAGEGAGATPSRRLDPALDLILGYPIFGAACWLVGLIRIAWWTMLPLVLIGVLLALRAYLVEPRPARQRSAAGVGGPSTGLIVIIFAAAFVAAQAPPTSIDEVAHHLAVPRAWANEGRAIDLPLISRSYLPSAIEAADLPFLITLGANGGIASHFLHLLAAIATTILIARAARRLASPAAANIVTAAIITTPALALTAGWSFVDWPLLGLCVALVFAENDRTTAAATAGGLLTSYTFLPFSLIVIALTKRWRAAWPGLAAGSLFFIRNLIVTGNPLASLGARDGAPPSLANYVFDDALITQSLGVAILILCLFTRGRLAWVLFGAAAALFFFAPSSRVLLPFLAIPAIHAAPAVEEWLERRRAHLGTILVLAACALQTFLVIDSVERAAPFAVLGGRATDRQFALQQRPTGAAIEWIDGTLPANARALIVGVNETYWFERRVRGGDVAKVSRYLEAPTPEALRAKLAKDGITHVAVVTVPRQAELTPDAQRMLAQLLDRYAASVASQGNATLFTLR